MAADPIEHVIVLMMENRSFDHMLGCFSQIYPKLDGIRQEGYVYTNTGVRETYEPNANEERRLDPSPTHEHRNVLKQISNGMSGFIHDYEVVPGSKPADYPAIMGYYPLDFLPATHRLGRYFTICDRWFSSLPGPTWPNRFFVHSGTCNGHVSMPEGFYHPDLPAFNQSQDTIYNRLEDSGINWGIFHHGLSQAILMQKLWLHPLRFHPITEFYDLCQNSPNALPQYSFLEPAFRGSDENDQHPPSDVMNGEALIAQVYNAVRQSEIWNRCLLVIVYDEHGGFYDHVQPPTAIAPDGHLAEFAFNCYGPRVPALLVSPYAVRDVSSVVFDHTSILRYVSDKWNLKPLTKRSESANSIGQVLNFDGPLLQDSPAQLDVTVTTTTDQANPSVAAHEQVLFSFARFLDARMDHVGQDAVEAYQRLRQEYGTLEQKFEVAKKRFAMFFEGKEIQT